MTPLIILAATIPPVAATEVRVIPQEASASPIDHRVVLPLIILLRLALEDLKVVGQVGPVIRKLYFLELN